MRTLDISIHERKVYRIMLLVSTKISVFCFLRTEVIFLMNCSKDAKSRMFSTITYLNYQSSPCIQIAEVNYPILGPCKTINDYSRFFGLFVPVRSMYLKYEQNLVDNHLWNSVPELSTKNEDVTSQL